MNEKINKVEVFVNGHVSSATNASRNETRHDCYVP